MSVRVSVTVRVSLVWLVSDTVSVRVSFTVRVSLVWLVKFYAEFLRFLPVAGLRFTLYTFYPLPWITTCKEITLDVNPFFSKSLSLQAERLPKLKTATLFFPHLIVTSQWHAIRCCYRVHNTSNSKVIKLILTCNAKANNLILFNSITFKIFCCITQTQKYLKSKLNLWRILNIYVVVRIFITVCLNTADYHRLPQTTADLPQNRFYGP